MMFRFFPPGRKSLLFIGIVLALLVLALGKQRENKLLHCRFGQEYHIANSEKKLIDAIAIASVPSNHPTAFWSDASGLYGRLLTKNAAALGEPIRIDSRCRGGIDAVANKETVLLACLRRPDDDKSSDQPNSDVGSQNGFVTLYSLNNKLETQRVIRFGEAGTMSKGIGVAVEQDRMRVVWHDGSISGQSVWLAEIKNTKVETQRIISRNKGLAGAPFILQDGERTEIVWAETWVESNDLRGEILLSDGKSAAYALADVHYHSSMPQLIKLAGETILAYRDQRSPSEPPGVFVARLGNDERITGDVVRIARADTEERPSLSSCFNGVVAAAPRTYGRDRMVGVNWFDASLSKLGGEQQFCEDSREFSMAASVCVDSRALLLIGERGSSTQQYTTIRGVTFWCAI
jgi:hypothetical protein